ncbi:MAG: ABC transporter permease [Verrucomicrobiota bacterium]
MTTYLIRRLLLIIPTLIGITIITFAISRMAPGNPLAAQLGMGGTLNAEAISQETIDRMMERYHFDKPLWQQYFIWLGDLAVLDFGISSVDNKPVLEKITERLPVTLQLSFFSILLSYLIAVPLGVMEAVRRGSTFDHTATILLFILYSMPSFWVALLLIQFLGSGEYLPPVFPVYGLNSPGVLAPWEVSPGTAWDWSLLPAWLGDRAWHLVLPVFCLTYTSLAALSRYARVSMLDVIRQDYVRTARAKGLNEQTVVFKHALRNALIPIITLLGSILPALIGGSIIIESIFSVPGMGQLGFESILNRDYNTVMGIATISALLTLVGFLIADLLYVLVDPRIRYD